MTKVKRNSKQIAGRSSHFCKQPLQKLSSSTPVAGLHSSVLSYSELIDHAATIQTLQYLYGVLLRRYMTKNDFTLVIPVNFVFFKSQYFPVGGKQNQMFYLELSH